MKQLRLPEAYYAQERHEMLRRRAPARRAGARARLRPRHPVLRRAALGNRLQAAQDAREGAEGHPPGDRQDLRLHHPQPRGGDGDERPDRRDALGQAGPGRARRRTSIRRRETKFVSEFMGDVNVMPVTADGGRSVAQPSSARPSGARRFPTAFGDGYLVVRPEFAALPRRRRRGRQQPRRPALQRICARLAGPVPGPRRRACVHRREAAAAESSRAAATTRC